MEVMTEIYDGAAPYLAVAVVALAALSLYRRGAREPWLALVLVIAVGLAFVAPIIIAVAAVIYWLVARGQDKDPLP